MINAKPIHAVIAFWLFAFSLAAFAQQPATVGDLLDKGGKKLTKDELSKLLAGATVSGIQRGRSGAKFHNTLNDDGSLRGFAVRVDGSTVGVFGKWSVNEQGQYCVDVRTTSGSKIEGCSFYFALANSYYSSGTDDRTESLYEREVKR